MSKADYSSILRNVYCRSGLIRKLLENRYLYIMLIPGIIFLILFIYMPMYGIVLAFKEFIPGRGLISGQWVGFANFKELFMEPGFPRSLLNTVIISFQRLIIGFPIPIILTLLLNEMKGKYFKKTVQTIIYLPHFISWVILSGIFLNLLAADGGVINEAIKMLGGEPVSFLSTPSYFRPIVISTGIWKEAGWGTIIYFAVISGIDPNLYEAAIIDGANRWRQIWHITLPSIRGVIVIMLILSLRGILDAGFEQIFLMYNPLVYETGDIIDTFVYRMGLLQGKYSMATALGLFKSVVAFMLIVAVNQIARKFGQEGIY